MEFFLLKNRLSYRIKQLFYVKLPTYSTTYNDQWRKVNDFYSFQTFFSFIHSRTYSKWVQLHIQVWHNHFQWVTHQIWAQSVFGKILWVSKSNEFPFEIVLRWSPNEITSTSLIKLSGKSRKLHWTKDV